MPIAGDVVVRFLGDLTQLNQSFDQVDARQKATATTAAASTVELKAAQAELRTAMAATTAEGGANADNMNRLADAEKRVAIAAAEAKEAHLALKEQLGIVKAEETALGEATAEVTAELGSMFALFAFAEGIKSFLEHTQQSVLQLELLHEKTGINITTLAGIEHVAESAGVKFESVSTALTRLSRAQQLAAEGNTAQISAFDRIGIKIDEIKRLNPEELFFRVGEALANSKTHAEANASAFQLLGRGGSALIPIFKQGGDELKALVEEAGRASGVTAEAGKSALEWEAAEARFAETTRALAIPAMNMLVPVMKSIEHLGVIIANGWRAIGATIGGVLLAAFDSLQATAQSTHDLLHGNVTQAWEDIKKGAKSGLDDYRGILVQFRDIHKNADASIADIWKEHKPFEALDEDFEHVVTKSKGATEKLIADAKAVENAQVAAAEGLKKANQLAYDQGKIDADTWANRDIAATMLARKAHEDYFKRLIEIHKAAKDSAKVAADEKNLEAEKQKTVNELLDRQDKITKQLKDETHKFHLTEAKEIEAVIGKRKDELTQVQLLDQNWQQFIPRWVLDSKKLAEALKDIGVTGLDQMRQKVDAAKKAEEALNTAGITKGRLWLEVQKAKLQATIALAQAEGKSAHAEVQALHVLEVKLRQFDRELVRTRVTAQETWQSSRDALETFKFDALSAFQALSQGGEAFGQALEQAMGKLVASLAQMWARFFFEKGIADIFFHPALGAAELAAAAGLEVLAGVAGGLGHSSGGGGSKETSSSGGNPITSASAVSAPNPTQAQNVPHLAEGGLVTGPTLLMAGDARSGGASRNTEAIIPLHNREAMEEIAGAIADRIGAGGGAAHFNIGGVISSDNLNKVLRQASRQVGKRQARLKSGTSFRVTRRA